MKLCHFLIGYLKFLCGSPDFCLHLEGFLLDPLEASEVSQLLDNYGGSICPSTHSTLPVSIHHTHGLLEVPNLLTELLCLVADGGCKVAVYPLVSFQGLESVCAMLQGSGKVQNWTPLDMEA